MLHQTFTVLFLLQSLAVFCQQKFTISDPKNQLIITADLFKSNDTLPYMLLCHQGGFSRGEYSETSKRFCKLGYNCISIDLRSGYEINGVKNETAALAKSLNKPSTFLDAEQDIISAINYIYGISKKPIILVGSAYSASLVLKLSVNNPKIKAVIAFSPGEYFGEKLNVKKSIANLDKTAFVTSTKTEAKKVSELLSGIKSNRVIQFIPGFGQGLHGACSLWKFNPNSGEYWGALIMFLTELKKTGKK